ncbi:MAG: hypothetical protein HKN27_14385 [Silicimonas sp.]|nr:hypothetical protein [Silicimonas sp.]
MTQHDITLDETAIRIDLAAALRLACRAEWHEGVANHFSAAVSADGRKFVINPRWVHWSRVKASDLVLCDVDDPATMERDDAPDPSAWAIHSALHATLPQARVALHMHPPYITALCCLKDPTIKPIEQVTARFFNRTAYDMDFGGVATSEAEGARIASTIGPHEYVMMANHGVTTLGATVAEAYDALYHMERAGKTLMLAYASGQPLNVLSDEMAESVAQAWEEGRAERFAHFAEMKRVLDRNEPDYKD